MNLCNHILANIFIIVEDQDIGVVYHEEGMYPYQ